MPGVFELLKRGWDLFIPNIRSYWIYLVLFFIISLTISILMTFYGPTAGTIVAKNWKEILSFSIVAIPLFIIIFYITLTLVKAMDIRLSGKKVNPAETFRAIGLRLLPTLGAYILALLPLIIGIILIVFVGLNIANKSLLSLVPSLGTWITTIVGILFVVLGMIAIVWFTFAHLEALLNHKGPIRALAGSFALVHGRWWHIFWLILATGIILSALAFLITAIFDPLITRLLIAEVFNASTAIQRISSLIISGVIGVLVGPWGYAITLVLYKAAKENPVKA